MHAFSIFILYILFCFVLANDTINFMIGLMKRIPRRLFCAQNLKEKVKDKVRNIPDIKEFIDSSKIDKTRELNKNVVSKNDLKLYDPEHEINPKFGSKYFIETYGCQMNVSDTEVVQAIMAKAGFDQANSAEEANVIFANTCSVRENAETKIWNKIKFDYKGIKKRDPNKVIGILGCMAERLKETLVDNQVVDIVAGPDSYRDIPNLINIVRGVHHVEDKPKAINVQLSMDETYADIIPVRKEDNGLHAWVSIMRGCNNMCAFCIVPFTRGRERSRPLASIVDEVSYLRDQGYKDITLLGQNVNSYHDKSSEIKSEHQNSPGFSEMFKTRGGDGARFADLLDKVSLIAPDVRFRFTSPHPKDFPDPVLDIISERPNLCKQIHLPAQSGNSELLFKMRRFYTRETYLDLVDRIRNKIPDVALSSDFIAGFCGETDEQFKDTLSLIEEVKYDLAYLFAYSMREKTHAHRKMVDDVPEDVKQARLSEMINVFKAYQLIKQKEDIGKYHLMLIDGISKRKDFQYTGLTDTNKRVVFNKEQLINDSWKSYKDLKAPSVKAKIGDFIKVKIVNASQNALFGEPICLSSIKDFNETNKIF